VLLGPRQPSRYGALRREPRRDGLATIEAAGLLLSALEKRPEIAETLNACFERMLEQYRIFVVGSGAKGPRLVAYMQEGVYECAAMGPRGGVVTQRSAKPCTPVQFRAWPPLA
jgi:hypothetical protein